jgi:hypothetical protein
MGNIRTCINLTPHNPQNRHDDDTAQHLPGERKRVVYSIKSLDLQEPTGHELIGVTSAVSFTWQRASSLS